MKKKSIKKLHKILGIKKNTVTQELSENQLHLNNDPIPNT